MKYSTPVMTDIEARVEIPTMADELSSCDGGHCVRKRYSGDH